MRIAASVALQDAPRPGLIVVHGLFTTRRFDYVREPAVRAFYEWGFNVAAVDLRSFGLTGLMNEAPSSGGWKEGEDLIAVARALKELGATSVGALGISLGASSVLGACHPEGADEALDGGILAVSPPADVGHATERLSRQVPLSHPAYALNYGFRAMLLSRVRGSRWPDVSLPAKRSTRSAAPTTRWTSRRSGAAPRPSTTSPTPRCRCSSCILRTTTSSRSATRRCSPKRRRATTWCASGRCPAAGTARSMRSTATGPSRSTGASSSAGPPIPAARQARMVYSPAAEGK